MSFGLLQMPTAATPNGSLGYWDLVNLAQGAGLPRDRAMIAAAIALAESGGRPSAHNGNAGTGDDSWGLWQINMIGGLGPARRQQFGISSNDQLTDPATNARAMAIVSGGGANFGPWTTYTSGKYQQFLNGAGPDPGGGVAGGGGGGGGAQTIADVKPSNESGCLIGGGDVLPSYVPFGQSIPCLFQKSWGWAILGGAALVGGATVMGLGAILVVLGAKKTQQVVGNVVGGIATGGAGTAAGAATATTARTATAPAAQAAARTAPAATKTRARPSEGLAARESAVAAREAASEAKLSERRRAARPRKRREPVATRDRDNPRQAESRDPNVTTARRRQRAQAAARRRRTTSEPAF